MPNLYLTLDVLKRAIQLPNNADDVYVELALGAISRQIDQWTGHHYYEETRSRYYRAQSGNCLYTNPDDLLSLTSLAVDHAGTRNYSSTYSATCYELSPPNALYASPPQPYWQVEMAPGSTGSFSMAERGNKVTGKWGYYSITETAEPVLGVAVSDTTTKSVTVTEGLDHFSVGHTIVTDAEQMYVRKVSNDILTVDRGVNGTTPATHAVSSTIGVFTYPVISQACLLQASRIFARKNSPLGVVGNVDIGMVRITSLDADVRALLENFRQPTGF